MMDKGLSLRQVEDFISTSADYTDFVKLGFGTSYLTKNLAEKIKLYKEAGIEALQKKLVELDPEFSKQIDLNNPHRLIRALEVCILTGKKYSELRMSSNFKIIFSSHCSIRRKTRFAPACFNTLLISS